MNSSTKRVMLFAADAVLLAAAAVGALALRFDGALPDPYLQVLLRALPLYLPLALLLFWWTGLYVSLWRYASVEDALRVAAAVFGASLLLAVLVLFSWIRGDGGFPRSVPILNGMLALALIGGFRFSIRLRRRLILLSRRQPRTGVPTLIIGAGDAGQMVAEEYLRHPELGLSIAGFVDDAKGKLGMRILGIPVLGGSDRLPELIRRRGIKQVILAIPSAPRSVVREMIRRCQPTGVRMRILPGVYELIGGRVTIRQIRDVQLEDLLGREPVQVDLEAVAGYLAGERVLVTGAGGSIGSELCRQIGRFQPAQLILLDHDENSIYELHTELQISRPDVHCTLVVADVRDRSRIRQVFQTLRPAVVFHAAAHKHVPLLEDAPVEAVKTNVFGTENVARAAADTGVKRFVLISTDKAVNPASVMGASKRVAEYIVRALQQDPQVRTRFMAVRFGNVLGSRGSVVPLFQTQIAAGGPVRVTHPEMRRYFMTISEAVQLVVQAGAMGRGGEVFVLDMGEPVRITELAENLIRLSGLEPYTDVPIVYTGIRPGEKLSEELLSAEEGTQATQHARIFVSLGDALDPSKLEDCLCIMEEAAYRSGNAGPESFEQVFSELIPTFRSASALQEAAATAETSEEGGGGTGSASAATWDASSRRQSMGQTETANETTSSLSEKPALQE